MNIKKTLKTLSGIAAVASAIGTALAVVKPDAAIVIIGVAAGVSKLADFCDDGKINNSTRDP